MVKPFNEACERNKQPILTILKVLFAEINSVLEIGSGTGQHAVYFAEALPHIVWYASDREENHRDIMAWLDETRLENTRPPLTLDVMQSKWPDITVDGVFSANTAHIMHWHAVEAFFSGVGNLLPKNGIFVLYGPFNYGNQYTSGSNARFDGWLKNNDPLSGIRNFEDLDQLANDAGMILKEDFAMPSNNRILCWNKV